MLASCITVYAVTIGSAVEIAPASAIFTSSLGVIPSSILGSLMWFIAIVGSFYIIQRFVKDQFVKQVTINLSVFLMILSAAIDGFWDFAVLVHFTNYLMVPIIVSSTIVSLFLTRHQIVETKILA